MIEDKFPKISIQNTKLRKLAEQYSNLISNLETRRVRKYALEAFLTYHNRKKTFEFQVIDIKKYVKYLSETKDKKESTIKNYLTALRLFFNYLITINVLEKNPSKRLKYSYKHIETVPNILSDEKLNEIFKPSENIINARNKLVIAVLLYTNINLDIIATIKKEELILNDRKYNILGEKIGVRANPIINTYLNLLENINTNYLFINIGSRNKNMPVSSRNIKEIVKVELSKIGVKSNFLKTIKSTKLFLEFKNHRSAKKLKTDNKLNDKNLKMYLEEFYKYFESSNGSSS